MNFTLTDCAVPCSHNPRCADRAQGESDERRMHIGVLLETVETLQAGSPGEREQRLVSLTAQLAALRSREAALERRASELLVSAVDSAMNYIQLPVCMYVKSACYCGECCRVQPARECLADVSASRCSSDWR